MTPRDGFNIEGLKEWQKWLQTLDKGEVDHTKDRILRTVGLRTLEYLHDLTPAHTGDLSGSFTMGGEGNVFDLKVGKKSYVVVGTNISYAQYVNDGFTQIKGQFVPGEWRGDTFHYIPGYKEGMVLTGKVVEGAHMFEKALDYVGDDIDTVVEFEFRRLYNMLFEGGG